MKKYILIIPILLILISCSTSESAPEKVYPHIDYFSASKIETYATEAVTLTWNVLHATHVEIDNGIGVQNSSGSIVVMPSITTTYTLTATNSDGSEKRNLTITVRILLVNWEKQMTSYGCPKILGTIKNIGDKPIYNVGIDFAAYNNANTIIDTASGFPADLGTIPAGVLANFDAIFFKLNSWTQIDHVTYTIDWLNVAGFHNSMSGVIK